MTDVEWRKSDEVSGAGRRAIFPVATRREPIQIWESKRRVGESAMFPVAPFHRLAVSPFRRFVDS
jgi:hypothetical protein